MQSKYNKRDKRQITKKACCYGQKQVIIMKAKPIHIVRPYWTYLLRGLDGCCHLQTILIFFSRRASLNWLFLSHSGEIYFQYIIRMCSDSPASSDIQDSLTLQHFSGRLGHKQYQTAENSSVCTKKQADSDQL